MRRWSFLLLQEQAEEVEEEHSEEESEEETEVSDNDL